MSQFYNPKRKADWNYGGAKWKLSRSKIDLFIECPRCFYLDNKLGTKRPPGFPLTLNVAVDELLKKEFDQHRATQTPHPIMEEYGIEAVPFKHADIDTWRENFEGVMYRHPETNMIISGAVDDVWQDTNTGELIVVDYKATSKAEEIEDMDFVNNSLNAQYKRQMEVYQWLLRKLGHNVSKTGYFLYANGDKSEDGLNAILKFRMSLIPCEGNDSWVEDAILKIHKALEDPRIPKAGRECDYCPYRDTVQELFEARTESRQKMTETKPAHRKTAPKKAGTRKPSPPDTGTLF